MLFYPSDLSAIESDQHAYWLILNTLLFHKSKTEGFLRAKQDSMTRKTALIIAFTLQIVAN